MGDPHQPAEFDAHGPRMFDEVPHQPALPGPPRTRLIVLIVVVVTALGCGLSSWWQLR